MDIRLYNTLSGTKEPFAPIDPSNARMYVCGPTVYDAAHLGNARPVVVFDVLYRLLRRQWPVTYVRNVTDVDDKIIAKAAATGEGIDALTARTFARFSEDVTALGTLPPTHQPRATGHVGLMVEMTMELVAKGHAYASQGHVLFDVSTIADFGVLSGRDRDGLRVGASGRGEPAPYKHDPQDFVLWKPSAPGQPGWDSPWGRGRPGWHIECSAMARAYLGDVFDIHGGGQDLIFPHHENEIAQTTAATGADRMANFWMHSGMLTVDGRKMSKSLGNVITVADVLARMPDAGPALRLLMLSTHYRQDFDFSWAKVEEAARRLRWLGERLTPAQAVEAEPNESVAAALADDLNTPLALSRLHALADQAAHSTGRDRNTLVAAGAAAARDLLGLDLRQPEASHPDAAWVEEMMAARMQARIARDFSAADAIRAELASAGVTLEDGPTGTRWRLG